MHNLVFFASGSGTNFQAVIDAIENGTLNANICGLITDRSGIGAIRRATKYSIPHWVIPPGKPDFAKKLHERLDILSPDLIVLAGYLKKIPKSVIEYFSGKMINIHPALLPGYGGKGYYGRRVHQAIIQNKETESGCTVHYVNEHYDRGAVISQAKVTVSPDDTPETLAEKVLEKEHQLLPSTIHKILTHN